MKDLDPLPSFKVCGVPIALVGRAEATEKIVEAARGGFYLPAHLCNSYTLSLVDSDPRLREALLGGFNIADGTPVAWIGRRHGLTAPVRGADLVADVCSRNAGELRHFLYGGAPGVAAAMAANLSARTGAVFVGVESPPFGEVSTQDLEELAARVVDTGADVLWVGLGTPKQDYVVADMGKLVRCPVVPVGAAFDFFAGTVAEAPKWMHGSGLEWIHRLI